MIYQIFKKIFLPQPPQKETTYIISFPKCGRTWLKVLIGEIFKEYNPEISWQTMLEQNTFTTNNPSIQNVTFSHDDKPLWKTPEQLDTNKQHYKNHNVIFLVRDPRDVVVSAFFEKNKRILARQNISNRTPFSNSIKDYVYHAEGSIATIIEFYNIWYKNKQIPKKFLLIKYEDLHKNTFETLQQILNFIGINNLPNSTIENAIKQASFNNMQQKEKENSFKSWVLTPGNISDSESYKVRKGEVGGYTNYLEKTELDYINQLITKHLNTSYQY